MLFIKKCYLYFFLIGCLSFNIIRSSDRQLTSTELEDGALTGIYPDWYIEEIKKRDFYEDIYKEVTTKGLLDNWKTINYVVSHSDKLKDPLTDIDKLRLKQLIKVVNNKSLSNAKKFFDIDDICRSQPKPSRYAMRLLDLTNSNYYYLNIQPMLPLDLPPLSEPLVNKPRRLSDFKSDNLVPLSPSSIFQ